VISGCYAQRLSFEISYSQEIHREVSLTRLLDLINPNFASLSKCHCEERSDEAIPSPKDCFAVTRNDRTSNDFGIDLRNSG
jgi:hypothetical protein